MQLHKVRRQTGSRESAETQPAPTARSRPGELDRAALTRFGVLVALIYVTPVILILTGVIPFSQRFTVLLCAAALVLLVERMRGREWSELGFRSDTLHGSLRLNVLLSVCVGAILGVSLAIGTSNSRHVHETALFYVFYVLVSSPSQEFLFRSAVFAELRRSGIKNSRWQVLFSTLIYVFPHSIYHDALTLVVVAAIGLVWGAIYARHPNWYGVALSHAVLGALSIAAGLV